MDRYGSVAVLRADGAGALAWVPKLVGPLEQALARLDVRTLVLRHADKGSQPRLEILFGPAPPPTVNVLEHGVPFVVDLVRGQKTGAFLDQRENRRRVGELSRGRTVCNLFSYAGGFSLHAAPRGSHEGDERGHRVGRRNATAQQSFTLANVDPRHAHEFVTADVFEYLARAKQRSAAPDLDRLRPTELRAEREVRCRCALAAYRALHRACAGRARARRAPLRRVLARATSTPTAFASTLDDAAALGRSDLRLLELFGLAGRSPDPCRPGRRGATSSLRCCSEKLRNKRGTHERSESEPVTTMLVGRFRAKDLLLLPGLLSMARVPLAILFPFVVATRWAAFLVLALASASDVADGWYARRYKQTTPTGAVVDPVTDKLFVLAVVVTLLVHHELPLRGHRSPRSNREIGELPLVFWFVLSHHARRVRATKAAANIPARPPRRCSS